MAGELDLLTQKKKTTEKNKQYKLNTNGAVIGIMLMYDPEIDPEKLFFSFTRNGELITKGWRSETISKRLQEKFRHSPANSDMRRMSTGSQAENSFWSRHTRDHEESKHLHRDASDLENNDRLNNILS